MGRTDKGVIAASWTSDSTAASGWLDDGAGTRLARYWNPDTPVGSPAATLRDINNTDGSIYVTALKSLRGPFTPKRQPNGQCVHIVSFIDIDNTLLSLWIVY